MLCQGWEVNEGYASVPCRCASIMLLLLQTAAVAPSCCNAPTTAGSMVGFFRSHCPGHMLAHRLSHMSAQHPRAMSCYVPCIITCPDTELCKPYVGTAFLGCEL